MTDEKREYRIDEYLVDESIKAVLPQLWKWEEEFGAGNLNKGLERAKSLWTRGEKDFEP
jgi:hypothetical protein